MILLQYLVIILFHVQCGQSQNMQRVAGGTQAKQSDWKFIVALFYRNSTIQPYSYFCSGVIINEWYILTAGHCAHDSKSSKLKIRENIMIESGQTKIYINVSRWHMNDSRHVIDLVTHPKYSYLAKETRPFDIAIFKVNRAFQFDGKVEPIPLGEPDEEPIGKCIFFKATTLRLCAFYRG